MENQYNAALQAAVADLYKQRKIKSNKEIAEKTGYKANTISQYVNGKAKASRDFLDIFEKAFGVDLSLYEVKTPNPLKMVTDDYQEKYIKLLEQQVAVLNTAITNNLSAISNSQHVILTTLQAHVKQEAWVRAKGVKSKMDAELDSVNKFVFEYQGVHAKKDSPVHSRGKE